VETCPRCGERAPERSRFCPACGTPISTASAARERRKVVTVIFADVVGSTALGESVDPETLRWAMQRWFGRMRDAVAHHGGTIENYIGDAVMAVFGIPMAHEDDALRAVRAATEMREQGAVLQGDLRRERGLDLAVRIGVNTGEAVTGTAVAAASFTAGDTVNVAARLEQAAAPGDILLGRETFRLVRHAVDAEPVAPLTVKGKREGLDAFRLLAVVPDASYRPARQRAAMVGRQRERRRLLDAFHQAVADRSCQLFTVLGAAGVGKSRLVAEVLETIDGAATVAAGRCLPYGDGLTWWPLAEALGASGLLERAAAEDESAAARATELLKPAGEAIAPEEAFWAVRKVLEALARGRPLVLVIDDLQWAEPTFIDLVEHVAERARNVPLLLLMMARHDLLDIRPGWGGGKLNATTALLEPLPETDARDLLGQLAGPVRLADNTVARILSMAEGNPLFVEEVVAMLVDDGLLPPGADDGSSAAEVSAIRVPPTIQALIIARLDRLGPGERAVVEAASIEGKEFARERVDALVADGAGEPVDIHLQALVRKDLIRPVGTDDDTFRFRHQLIRDVTYEGISKELRAGLHERFANLLEASTSSTLVAEELLGYHLERAVLLQRELGVAEATTADLSSRASKGLRAAGRRAAQRDDPAAVRLLESALALTPEGDRAPVLVELAGALDGVGDLEGCAARAAAALSLARARGDLRTAARARVIELRVTMDRSLGETDLVALDAAARPVLDELDVLGDDEGMATALLLLGHINMNRFERSSRYLEGALVAAERVGDRKTAAFAAGSLGLITVFGPVPAGEGIKRCRALRRRVADHLATSAVLLRHEAVLHAMQNRIDEARGLHAEADRILDDLGNPWASAGRVFGQWAIELLAGEPQRAEAVARASLELFEEMGATNQGSTAAALLAVALVQQGRHEEALHYADLAASWAAPDDIASQAGQLAARAHALTARGELESAEACAREAVRLSERSDDISQRGDALTDLSAVLERAGRADEAAIALRRAIALYERKGNIVSATRAQTVLERLKHGAGIADV
jgi:class 3 adenylate cyclase/tetratricopeptide (TPR) repeat protein